MSDDLHTYIEPELEARITALVLGEASEFEVDELERLIEEKPELAILQRRLEVMHQLLGEAMRPQPDANWKLSADRRAVLEKAFVRNGQSAATVSKKKKPSSRPRQSASRSQRKQVRASVVIAACVMLCLILFMMATPVVMNADKTEFEPQIVTYSASPEAKEDTLGRHRLFGEEEEKNSDAYKWNLPRGETAGSSRSRASVSRSGEKKVTEKSIADNRQGVPVAGDIPITGRLFKSKGEDRVARRELDRSVERKPSIPSSGMARVIASNTTTNIPVPEAVIPSPSDAFGNGDDFGDGWEAEAGVGGGGAVSGGIGGEAAESKSDPFSSPDRSKTIAQNGKGRYSGQRISRGKSTNEGLDLEVPVDGSITWAPSKPSEVDADGLIAGKPGQIHLGLTDGQSGGFETDLSSVLDFRYTDGKEGKKNNGRISPVDGGGRIESRATAGLRSGDYATTRDSVDAILNNPNRVAVPPKKAPGIATITGVWDSGISMDFEEELERLQRDGTTSSVSAYVGASVDNISKRESGYGLDDEVRYSIDPAPSKPTGSDGLGTSSIAKKEIARRGLVKKDNSGLAEVEHVRKKLYLGEGYYNLGKYDEAEAQYKKVLQVDPHNKAARRWLEKVAATKSDYYRAAYDHTRAELLKEVDKAWELSVPQARRSVVIKQPVAKPTPVPSPIVPATSPVGGKGTKLAAMKQELQSKNDRVAEKRKKLMDIAERVGLVWVETEKGGKTLGNTHGLREQAEKELYEAEREMEQVDFQMNKLRSVNDGDLIGVAAELPEVGFKDAYSKYEDAKSALATKKASGLSSNHPDVQKQAAAVAAMEKSLEKRALNVRKSLTHRLSLAEGRVKQMKSVVNGLQDKGSEKARAIQEFNLARKDYQTALSIKDRMEIAYDIEKSKQVLPPSEIKTKSPQRPSTTIPSPVTPKALPDETKTTAKPFSTFSLNVSDVSFKLAKVALLEKGQWPNAAKVRTEEFVNAFDYGDPSPRRGEPVTCAVDQSAHPFLQQRNLLRVGMKTASIGRSAPLRLTVLLDNSGSMEREDRETSVLAAIRVLASQLGPQDVITVVGFARQPRLLADRISGDKAHKLVEIVASTPSEGGTNIEEALRLARTLAKRQHTDGAQDRVVLITDGVANLGNTIPKELSKQIIAMRQEGIAFDACGVGAEGLNDDILEALTRKGDGRYYFLNRAEDADSGFAKQLAGALTPAAKNVKVQVKFNPNRVSRYRLLGFEKHRLKKEDFRNDKVDAAEMAAEEAGNAVYQIQVNPQGTGELGEVFVRFLDVSTGRMVERSWPLPYEPQAPSFDLAAPSMQLAGTAAMLGEKLHGTDAGSVRFPMISDTLNKLRGHFAADPKVQDLIRMCRKVK